MNIDSDIIKYSIIACMSIVCVECSGKRASLDAFKKASPGVGDHWLRWAIRV